jgi:hypothetical protein
LPIFISDILLKSGPEGEEESLPLVTFDFESAGSVCCLPFWGLFVEFARDEPDK